MRGAVVAKRLQGVHTNTSPHPELHPCHPRTSGTTPRMTCVGLSVTSLGRGERAAPWILGTLGTSPSASKSEDDMGGAVGVPKPASIHGPARAAFLAAEASGAEAVVDVGGGLSCAPIPAMLRGGHKFCGLMM